MAKVSPRVTTSAWLTMQPGQPIENRLFEKVLKGTKVQDRYTGDIGDFSKLGLLRALHDAGLSIGLNWYLTPDETHNADGLHVKYLDQDKFRECDEGLWLELKAIVKDGKRKVRFMENDSVLKATFFSECLDFSGKTKLKRRSYREEWYGRSLTAMDGKDVVCVDPDNGLIVPSAMGRPKENKYVLREELAGYYAQGSSVIYYQHKARRKDAFYIRQHAELVNSGGFLDAKGLVLKFNTTSQRYYMFIIQPKHWEGIEKTVSDLLTTSWAEHFCIL